MNKADKRLKQVSLIFHINSSPLSEHLRYFVFAAELLWSMLKQKINGLIEFFFSEDRGSYR